MRLRTVSLALGTSFAAAAFAADPGAMEACTAVPDAAQRLACYDKAAGRTPDAAPSPAAANARAAASESFASFEPRHDAAALPRHARRPPLDLDPGTVQPLFEFRPHNQNYVLAARWSDNPNNNPFRSAVTAAGSTEADKLEIDDTEVKLQLSFKNKLWQDVLGAGGNLWFGYTQQSHWQLYNGSISRPFRETNYEPEVIYNQPLDWTLLGMNVRYASLAFNHQSNGRSEPLSRSWNRVYAELGLERGNFALMLRPWWRIPESDADDDNPDITDYIGRGEVTGVYSWNGHQFGARLRSSFNLNEPRGSVLADWSFPLAGALRGYVQAFTGYGESLIDYNWRQTTAGIGVILTDRR